MPCWRFETCCRDFFSATQTDGAGVETSHLCRTQVGKEDIVVELGCSYGKATKILCEQAGVDRVVGVDLGLEALDACQKVGAHTHTHSLSLTHYTKYTHTSTRTRTHRQTPTHPPTHTRTHTNMHTHTNTHTYTPANNSDAHTRASARALSLSH